MSTQSKIDSNFKSVEISQVQALQHELILSHQRINELEEEKQQYQDHLDELILTVAKRSQNIRDIERDLQKISAWQASQQDNSIDSQDQSEKKLEVYQTTPENNTYQMHTYPSSQFKKKRTYSMQNISPYQDQRLIDSEVEQHAAYSEQVGPSYFTSPKVPQSSRMNYHTSSLSPPQGEYIILDSNQKEFSEIEALRKSVESLELRKEVQHLKTKIESPMPYQSEIVEELKHQLKKKSEKLKGVKSMLEVKTKQLNLLQLDLSQLKLSLKLIKENYCSRLRSELEGIKRDMVAHSRTIERQISSNLTHLYKRQKQNLQIYQSRAISMSGASRSDATEVEKDHSVELDQVKRVMKLEMEAKIKRLLLRKGDKEEITELKMKILQSEREKEELAIRLDRVIGKVGEDREKEIATVQTVRRKQIEKSYSELALDMEERLRNLQSQLRQETAYKRKLMKSLQNLIRQLEREERKGKVDERMTNHNITVLKAVIEGRSYSFESLQFGVSGPGKMVDDKVLKEMNKVRVKKFEEGESNNSMSATPKGEVESRILNPLFMMDF